MKIPDIRIFDYWDLNFEIISFLNLADEIQLDGGSDSVFVITKGSVIVIDSEESRNEFKESQGFSLDKKEKYLIRSSSELTDLICIKKNI